MNLIAHFILATTCLFGVLLMSFGADLAPSNHKFHSFEHQLPGTWPAGCGFSIVSGIFSIVVSAAYLHSHHHIHHEYQHLYIFAVYIILVFLLINMSIWAAVVDWSQNSAFFTTSPPFGSLTFCQASQGSNYCDIINCNLAFTILLMFLWGAFAVLTHTGHLGGEHDHHDHHHQSPIVTDFSTHAPATYQVLQSEPGSSQ